MQAQNNRPATKAELVLLKKEIVVSRDGLELLEYKRDILVAESLKLLKSSRILRSKITRLWEQIESNWQKTLEHQSDFKIQNLAVKLEPMKPVSGANRRWMSVSLANYKADLTIPELMGSVSELDLRVEQVRGRLSQLMPELTDLMNQETNIRRIAVALKRSHRQVNALTQVVIPELEHEKIRIEQRLEEKERETIFQVKLLKARQS